MKAVNHIYVDRIYVVKDIKRDYCETKTNFKTKYIVKVV